MEDVIEYAGYALDFAKGVTEAEFLADRKLQFAIIRALEVVGEATKSVPEEVRLLAPEIPWRQIIVTRNKIAHHYFGVKLDVVWQVVAQELNPLIASMKALLGKLPSSEAETSRSTPTQHDHSMQEDKDS